MVGLKSAKAAIASARESMDTSARISVVALLVAVGALIIALIALKARHA